MNYKAFVSRKIKGIQLFVALFCLLQIIACDAEYHRKGVAGGSLQQSGELLYYSNEDIPYSGYFYWEESESNCVGYVENGLQSGKFTVWFKHGPKQFEAYYKNGVHHGKATSWYSNGKIRFVKYYEDGKMIKEDKIK